MRACVISFFMLMQTRVQETEDALSTETDVTRRKGFAAEQHVAKQQLEGLAVAQAQWAELNRRLDELERELASRQ